MNNSIMDVENYNLVYFELKEHLYLTYNIESKEWVVIKEDDEEDDEIVIESEKDNIIYKDNLELFDGYILTKEEFDDCKDYIEDDM